MLWPWLSTWMASVVRRYKCPNGSSAGSHAEFLDGGSSTAQYSAAARGALKCSYCRGGIFIIVMHSSGLHALLSIGAKLHLRAAGAYWALIAGFTSKHKPDHGKLSILKKLHKLVLVAS